ncbi:DUF1961 family protein [Pedobacter sp. SD-b]|uniref:DUF1961 family protein n=1 Tax=Pedobacter segetis TaxID=2793069 RepID=A0ABS1BLD9_9SPHI|nr:DUF1961 family protein [Pedobacter segetis]MBK0383592.1 DUF1961 family protein [Pedobacter segetis]
MLSRIKFVKSILGAGIGSVLLPKLSFAATADNKEIYTSKLIYENELASEKDVANFIMEGQAKVSFPNGKMQMENKLDPSLGQKSNFVFWCDKDFPANISITWEFKPLKEPGLCMFFFAAQGKNEHSIFDKSLKQRAGEYGDYHHGDINTYHLSYFRRKQPNERVFNLCNLRKSYGFHMVAQGADPIPCVDNVVDPYQLKLIKFDNKISFFINDLSILSYTDDGKTFGSILNGGKIGFRQMAPLIGEYSNLRVYTLS